MASSEDIALADELTDSGAALVVPFRDRIGAWLAFTVLGAMIGITVLIGVDWAFRAPDAPNVSKGACASLLATAATPPSIPASATTSPGTSSAIEACREVVSTFRSLSDQADKRATTAFDSVVVKVFFPILTALLGYLFATKSGNA